MVVCKPKDLPEDLASIDARIAEHAKAIQMLKESLLRFLTQQQISGLMLMQI